MKSVQATEAKAKFAELLRDVERGEVVQITRHGKTIARIVPEIDERARRRAAVQAILDYQASRKEPGMTVGEFLSARDEGRRPL